MKYNYENRPKTFTINCKHCMEALEWFEGSEKELREKIIVILYDGDPTGLQDGQKAMMKEILGEKDGEAK